MISGNTKKVERRLKEIAQAKKYVVVDQYEDARYSLLGERSGCSVPFACGRPWYTVYYYSPVSADPRPGMMYITAQFTEKKRARAIEETAARLPECPDAI